MAPRRGTGEGRGSGRPRGSRAGVSVARLAVPVPDRRRMAVTSRPNPYLSFSDTARQAMEFYRGVFGGDLVLSTFGEAGGAEGPDADKIMHAQLETPAGYTLMASDTPAGMSRSEGSSISVSLSGDDGDDLRRYFRELADGGSVTMPLEK